MASKTTYTVWVRNPSPTRGEDDKALEKAIKDIFHISSPDYTEYCNEAVGCAHVLPLPGATKTDAYMIAKAVQVWHQARLNADQRVQRDHAPDKRVCSVDVVANHETPEWARTRY